jgi:lipopolysaccharide transport system ATP-binding protein
VCSAIQLVLTGSSTPIIARRQFLEDQSGIGLGVYFALRWSALRSHYCHYFSKAFQESDMSDITMEFNRVSKVFSKGDNHDSLRDLIPALFNSASKRRMRTRQNDKEFWAIKDLSFQVKRGEALAIIGPNGSGKSTTLKLLSRILRPTLGTITVVGRMSALIEVAAGFHPDLTGMENIYLNGAILGMTRSEIASKLDQIIEFSGISEFIDTPVKRYSSGMYARLGFSIAAHVDPDILLVDEVLSVGDNAFQGRCIRRMHEILKNGTTVIFVSHNMEAVVALCDRAILLKKGVIESEGTPATVISAYFANGADWGTPEISNDRRAQIDRIECISDSSVAGVVVPGTHHKYELSIKAHDTCRLSPGIFIRRSDTPIFDTTYGLMTGDILTLAKDQTVKLVWDIDLNLPAGSYDIGFHLEDVDHNNFHEYIYRYRTLLVVQDRRCKGEYHLNPRVALAT